MTRVERADDVTDELVEAFARLVPQLSSTARPPGGDALAELLRSPATTVFVARDDSGRLVGSLTLALYRIPTGMRAWIEDVVVDETARGGGVGEALTRAALATAREAGAHTVDLTSRPAREAANRLYERVGFAKRGTNVYRFEL